MLRTVLLLAFLAAPAMAAPPPARPPAPGETIYREVCQACHMADARGAVGAGRITGLARNPNLEYPDYAIAIVTGGKGPMPWFRGNLTDQQIADVIGYVRTHFGNRYKSRVTAAQVAELGVPAPKGQDR